MGVFVELNGSLRNWTVLPSCEGVTSVKTRSKGLSGICAGRRGDSSSPFRISVNGNIRLTNMPGPFVLYIEYY